MPPLFQCISLKKFETKRMDVNICDEHFTVLQTITIGTQTVTWKYYVKANIMQSFWKFLGKCLKGVTF